jgi:hypothetical protein
VCINIVLFLAENIQVASSIDGLHGVKRVHILGLALAPKSGDGDSGDGNVDGVGA